MIESLQKTLDKIARVSAERYTTIHQLRSVLRPAVEAARERTAHRIYNSECEKRNNVVLNCTRDNDKTLLEAGKILGISEASEDE